MEPVDLHDAIIKRVAMDFRKREVIIEVDYYNTASVSARGVGFIIFSGVKTIAQNIDFIRLSNQEWAGNVTYWVPSAEGGVTYIYLSDGFISVDAEFVVFSDNAISEGSRDES